MRLGNGLSSKYYPIIPVRLNLINLTNLIKFYLCHLLPLITQGFVATRAFYAKQTPPCTHLSLKIEIRIVHCSVDWSLV